MSTIEKIKDLDGLSLRDVLRLLDAMGKTGEYDGIPGREIEARNADRLPLSREADDPKTPIARKRELWPQIEAKWTEPNHIKESKRHAWELYRGRSQAAYASHPPLAIDHTRVWSRGRFLCVTTEPYHLERGKLERAVALCEAKNLAGYVHYAAEVHNPDDCIGIVFVKAGDEEKLPTLAGAIAARAAKT